jgi:hypothetical protein
MASLLARVALAAVSLLPAAALAAAGYELRTVALQGAPAPGTADAYGEFLDVDLDAAGRVAFGAPLSSGFPNAGVWVDPGTGAVLHVRNGQPAPPPQVGTYLAFGSFARLDASGRLGFASILTGGIDGIFLDSAGTDSVLVAEGHAAPTPPGGTFAGGISDLGFFGMNGAGDVAFRANVTGGSQPRGVFVRSAGGSLALIAGAGDPVTGGPETFTSFGYPAINDAGALAYSAVTNGGPASPALLSESGGGRAVLARAGDSAPGTGGGTVSDFLYPALGAGGEVVFLAPVAGSGSGVTGGVFVASPALASVVVEHQSLPGAGPVSQMASLPSVSSDGAIPLSLAFASGPVAGGVYVYDAGDFGAVALAGEHPPGSGGAALASFGMVKRNAAGQVAFVGTLDDGRKGVFLATPAVPAVPALPIAAAPILALLLLGLARARI